VGGLARRYYDYLGRLYRFAYLTDRRALLGIRLSRLAQLAALLPLAAAWVGKWPALPLALALLLFAWVQFGYWRARRAGYHAFVADKKAAPPPERLPPLPDNQQAPALATGLFAVNQQEEAALLRPAHYWRTPLGDHGVMVAQAPGRYRYQFFDGAGLQAVTCGWLIHGSHPRRALAVTFLTTWGQESAGLSQFLSTSQVAESHGRKRTIYLAFDDPHMEQAVWRTLTGGAADG